MPFSRPTLQELRNRIAADFELNTEGNPHLRGTLEFAQVNALAGAAHSLYGAIDFYSKQLFDLTAEDEFILRRAEPYGLFLIPAQAAGGDVKFTGTSGTLIPAGTELQAPNEQLYTTDEDVTITASVAIVRITAVEAGVAGNQEDGTVKLTLTSPIPGVNSEAGITDGLNGLGGGAEQESMERFKQRFAERKANPPRGGSRADYIAWAKQASVDVGRVWVFPHKDDDGNTEYGSVTVFFTTNDPTDPIPSGILVGTVTDYIDQLGIRPIGAKNIYVGIAGADYIPLDITVTKLVPNTPEVQAAIEAEVADLLYREAEPGGTILLSQINEAFSIASGETDHVISVPAADVPTAFGELLVPGTFTWPGA